MKIEVKPSTSGKTFAVALSNSDGEEFLVVKGCRIAQGSRGRFVSGPSAKMDDGKWLNYTYMAPRFSDAVLAKYDEHNAVPAQTGPDPDDDIPF